MMLPHVCLGLRELYGSWKIICIRRRNFRTSELFSLVRSAPSKITSPSVGLYSCSKHRPVVVFPQPLSPTRPSVSPRRIVKLTSSTALMSATFRWKITPEVTGKYILRFRISTRFS